MQFIVPKADAGKKHTYRVIAVNTVGLKSPPSADAMAAPAPKDGPLETQRARSESRDVSRHLHPLPRQDSNLQPSR
jgi:hypothetical protein